MMHGLVNINYQAMLRLVIETDQHQPHNLDAIISTTFEGYLGLPANIIALLNLPPHKPNADRQAADCLYQAMVLWDQQYRCIPVTVISGEPIVGMKLLKGYALQIQVTQHGIVTVDRIH